MRFCVVVWLSLLLSASVGVVGCAPQKKCVCVCKTPPPRDTPRPKRTDDGGYIAKLLKDKPFVAYRTKRIHLYYYKGSEAEKDRDVIVKKREKALDRLEKFFGKKPPRPIRVFLFPSRKAARPYRVGTASPALLACYGLYQKGHWTYEKHYPGHELTHIFSNTDASWQTVHVIGLLDEGLAEHFSGFHLDTHFRLTQHMQVAGRMKWYIRIRAGRLDYRKMGIYEFGGSFVKFLIETQPQGRAKLLELLRLTRLSHRRAKADFQKLKAVLNTTYGKNLTTLTQQWNRTLAPYWQRSYTPRPADVKAINQLASSKSYGTIQRIFFFRFKWYLQLVLWIPNKRRVVVSANAQDGWSVPWKPRRRQ